MLIIFAICACMSAVPHLSYEGGAPRNYEVAPLLEEPEVSNFWLGLIWHGKYPKLSVSWDSRFYAIIDPFKQPLYGPFIFGCDKKLKCALSVIERPKSKLLRLTSQGIADLEAILSRGDRWDSSWNGHLKNGKLFKDLLQIWHKMVGKQRYLTPLGEIFQINTHTSFMQHGAMIIGLRDGGFVIGWTSWYQDGSYSGVYGQIFDSSGNKVGEEFQINTTTDGSQSGIAILRLTNENLIVVWSDTRLSGQLYDSSFTKIGEEIMLTDTANINKTIN